MGHRTPDIYSADLLCSAPVSIDVRAISDAALSGQASMRRAAKIINETCEKILTGASAHLHYAFQEQSGYLRDDSGKARFNRHRKITLSFQMEASLRAILAHWLEDEPRKQPLRLTAKHIDVVVTWQQQEVHPQLNTFCTMPSLAYSLRENPLYEALKGKSDQLRLVPDGVHSGIFLGDAGCQLLSNIYRVDRVNHTFSGQQVIEAFLADEKAVDFVAVFSVKRAKEGPWDTYKNPRIWYLYLFEQKRSARTLDLSSLLHLRDVLPAPYLSGYEARSWHELGMFSPQARGRYVPTNMSIGRRSMIVKISARALQELMAGRLTADEFEHWTTGQPNPFERQLAAGLTISGVSFEPKNNNADDDYLTFTFRDDPAATALRLPEQLLVRNKEKSPTEGDK
jgi:hypothetical protein